MEQNTQNKTLQPPQPYDSQKQYPLHQVRYKEGGIWMSKEKNSIGVNAVGNILKQISGKLISGQIKNIMSVSKPVSLCSDLSFLELIALDNSHTPLLDLAALNSNNPVKRLQYIMAFLVANIPMVSNRIFCKIPLDPVLGETCQLENEDGVQFQAEALNTVPPEGYATFQSKDKTSWKLQYNHIIKATLSIPGMNDLEATALNYKTFVFEDGSEIIAENVSVHVSGIIMGDRVLRAIKTLRLIDVKNNLVGDISFQYSREGTMTKLTKSFTGMFGGGNKENKRDLEECDVQICKYSNPQQCKAAFYTPMQEYITNKKKYTGQLVSQGTGNYLSYFQMDNQLLWQMQNYIPKWITSKANTTLPSDTSNRYDKQLLQINDVEKAEKAKLKQEQQSIKDQQLREQQQQKKK